MAPVPAELAHRIAGLGPGEVVNAAVESPVENPKSEGAPDLQFCWVEGDSVLIVHALFGPLVAVARPSESDHGPKRTNSDMVCHSLSTA